MYIWIWHRFPGPTPVKALLAVLLAAAAVYALFEHVFPWLDSLLPFNSVTVSETTGATT